MPFGHKNHLLRVAALFAGGILVFLTLQTLLVPKGFGAYGHYRPGALDDSRARPLAHAGRAACVECHTDVWDTLKVGKHAAVHCEACHGALARHAADPSAAEGVKPDSKVLCARCHQANVARPASFPQIDVADHAGTEACTSCHKAHDPLDNAAAAAATAPSPAPGSTPAHPAMPAPQKGASQ